MFKKYCILIVATILIFLVPNSVYAESISSADQSDNTLFLPDSSKRLKIQNEKIKIHYGINSKDTNTKYHEIEVILDMWNETGELETEITSPIFPAVVPKENVYFPYDFKVFSYPDMKEISSFSRYDREYLDFLNFRQYTKIYSWKSKFAANEKKSFYLNYKIPFEHICFVSLSPSSAWRDKISHIDIICDFNKPASFPEILALPYNYFYNGSGIEWHFSNIEPNFYIQIQQNSIPSFFKQQDNSFSPRQVNLETLNSDPYNISYGYNLYKTNIWEKYYCSIPNNIDSKEKLYEILEKVNFVRNEIFARHGYIFESDNLKKIFNIFSWYIPDSKFSYSYLNNIETENVEYLNKFEQYFKPEQSNEDIKLANSQFNNELNSNEDNFCNLYNLKEFTIQNKINDRETVKSLPKDFYENILDFSGDKLPEISSAIDEDGEILRIIYAGSNKIILANAVQVKSFEKPVISAFYIYENGKLHKIDKYIGTNYIVSPDGNYIVLGNSSLDLKDETFLISTDTGKAYSLEYAKIENLLLSWSANSKYLVLASKDGINKSVKIFDAELSTISNIPYKLDSSLSSIDINNEKIITIESDSSLYLFDTANNTFEKFSNNGCLLGFVNNGTEIAFASEKKIVFYNIIDKTYKQITNIGVKYKLISNKQLLNIDSIHSGIINNSTLNRLTNAVFLGEDKNFYVFNMQSKNLFKFPGKLTGYLSPSGDKILTFDQSAIITGNLKNVLKIISYNGNESLIESNSEILPHSVWLDDSNIISIEKLNNHIRIIIQKTASLKKEIIYESSEPNEDIDNKISELKNLNDNERIKQIDAARKYFSGIQDQKNSRKNNEILLAGFLIILLLVSIIAFSYVTLVKKLKEYLN